MKTTLNLPDELLIEAKSMAARRRTTLKALVEHALRRELQGPSPDPVGEKKPYERNDMGFLVLKRSPSDRIHSEDIQKIRESIEEEEFQQALHTGETP